MYIYIYIYIDIYGKLWEKDLGKEARNVTEIFFVIISKIPRSRLSAGWLEEVVSIASCYRPSATTISAARRTFGPSTHYRNHIRKIVPQKIPPAPHGKFPLFYLYIDCII